MIKTFQLFTTIIGLVALLASCKSLRKITTKDGSSTTTATKKKTVKKPEFIDGIEVKPGSVITSKHKTSGLKKTPTEYAKVDSRTSNIEKADWLQLKYAIVINTNVETLNNLPLLARIDEWWGTRYCLGGSTKNCIDCSAFSVEIMKNVYGIQLPRTAQEQFNNSEKISIDDLKEGDLVFFQTSGRAISHVGIYVANNKFVHASTSGGVTITDMDDKYWKARYKGAGRVRKL